jgi:hypothetical protein
MRGARLRRPALAGRQTGSATELQGWNQRYRVNNAARTAFRALESLKNGLLFQLRRAIFK